MTGVLPYRLVVTAGATREWLDPIRFLSNPASGLTGFCVASSGIQYFHEVIYITGKVEASYKKIEGVVNISVESTKEMHDAVHSSICDQCILVMTAAPADYTPKNMCTHKIKKKNQTTLSLELLPTVDILKSLIPLAKNYKHFYRIGFAAETQNIIKNANKKLREKDLSFIFANQVYKDQMAFGPHENTLILLYKNGKECRIGPAPKKELAKSLIETIIKHLSHIEKP